MPLSADTLVRLGVPRDKARRHLPHLRDAMREFDITTQRRAECFLAQLMHESGTLQFFEEIASGDAYEGRRDLGNVKPGDGRRYKGRGPIQLTGRTNYRKAGEALGVDFEAKPKLVSMPRYGYRVAGWFWKSRGLNELADANRFEEITRRINGAATAGPPSHQTRRVALRARIAAHDVRPGKPDRQPAKAKAKPTAKARPRPRPDKVVGGTAERPHGKAVPPTGTELIERATRLDARSDRALEQAVRRATRLERLEAARGPLDPASLGALGKELGQLAEAIGEVRSALAEAVAPRPNGNGHPETVADIAARLRQHDLAGDTLREELAERLETLEAKAGRNGTPTKAKQKPTAKPGPKRAPTLKLTTPLMKGKGIARLQRTINRQLATWNVDHRIKVDGEFGPDTREAVRRVAYGLGLSTKALDHGVTAELRERILDPKTRSATERERARKRRPWIRRLRRRYEGHGPAAAIAYARKHIGVKEDAGRPNRGRLIDQWNTATGIPLNSQAFWCGAFVNACLTASGLPPDRVLAWCPGIEARAKAGTGGWSWHSKPRPGDLALFTHGGVAGHVGIVESVDGKSIRTIEGNTSPNGTTNNGYGVFRRSRSLPIRGFARPPYDR
jgi:uncharacterized protein (TIGR02594 family)